MKINEYRNFQENIYAFFIKTRKLYVKGSITIHLQTRRPRADKKPTE